MYECFSFSRRRELAESSPYFEAMRARDVEVLFAFESYDELVLTNLREFDRKQLRSIEGELSADNAAGDDGKIDPNGESVLYRFCRRLRLPVFSRERGFFLNFSFNRWQPILIVSQGLMGPRCFIHP